MNLNGASTAGGTRGVSTGETLTAGGSVSLPGTGTTAPMGLKENGLRPASSVTGWSVVGRGSAI